METATIKFTATDERLDYHVTSWEAAQMIARYTGIILANTWRAVNRFAHNWPWVIIIATVLASTMLSVVWVGQARAERDKAVGQQWRLQRQVEQLTIREAK